MNPKNLIFLLLGYAAIAFVVSCERDWNNPWDEFNNLSPEAWAPQNLQIEDVSITEKKLTWTYGNQNIEGFKIDRKKGDESWQVDYQTLPKEARSWNDTEIIPNPSLTYEYRVYAFAGKLISAQSDASSVADFAAPSSLMIEKLTDKSYRLTWTDNSAGEQGFKIDRKIDENNWATAFGTVSANQTSFIDTNVFRATSVEYRVYGFYEGCESVKVSANVNAALTSPTGLSVERNSMTSVTLNWQTTGSGQDGFKIERKYDDGNWEQLATTKISNFQDNSFQLDTMIFYRVCAYVGLFNSTYAEKAFNSQIPAPSKLIITPNSISSITLSWQDNSNGEEGFKIDRKINTGAWELMYASFGSNQTSFSDIGIDWQTNSYSYRLYSFFGVHKSITVENAISWPIVITTVASNITKNSATSGGSIAIQGNYSITARGVCYGTSTNPDLSGLHTTGVSGTGTFVSSITGLSFLSTYYLRAYATTDFGTVYGENRNFTTLTPDIGDTYAGGIVFYLDGSGGGLVCALYDQSAGAEWGCYGITVGAYGNAIGTGAANTVAIVAGCSQTGIAARICNYLVLNGYSDWFLPSIDELNLMYLNLKQAGIGGFASAYYWSSSEYYPNLAWTLGFHTGSQYYSDKENYDYYVRAVRAF